MVIGWAGRVLAIATNSLIGVYAPLLSLKINHNETKTLNMEIGKAKKASEILEEINTTPSQVRNLK